VVGYIIINLCTFFIDLIVLGVCHGLLKVPLPIAVTCSYGTAAVVSYVANRVLNFQSHGAVGRQLVPFVAAELANYLIFVLGLTDGLAAAGVYFELARVIAACCEGVFLYCCMRWLVFRDTLGSRPTVSAEEPVPAAQPGPTEQPAGPEASRQAPAGTREQ